MDHNAQRERWRGGPLCSCQGSARFEARSRPDRLAWRAVTYRRDGSDGGFRERRPWSLRWTSAWTRVLISPLFWAHHRVGHFVMPIQGHVLGILYGVTVEPGVGDSSGWV